MKLSVIILNYNVRYFLELCLQSVKEATKNLNSEIIVIDNNSIDESCDFIKEKFPEVILIENKENFGFAKGNNIGVKVAKGEYICILNPDTFVAEDTFETVLSFADKQKNLGMVGCRLIDGKGKFLPESKRNVPIVKVSFQKIFGNSTMYYASHIDEFKIGKIDVLVGAFMIMKRSVYNQVKGFDEDYFMYGEDIDLSYKLIKEGYNNYYNPTTTVVHFKGESTLKDKHYARQFYNSMQIFYKKHFKRNILFDLIVVLGIKAAYVIRQGPKGYTGITEKYIVLSDKKKEKFATVLNKNIEMYTELKDVSIVSEVIFDADFVSYKEIISYMSNPKINSKATFKIYPKNANFILGSNDSKNRGEVIKFVNNLKKTSKIY